MFYLIDAYGTPICVRRFATDSAAVSWAVEDCRAFDTYYVAQEA